MTVTCCDCSGAVRGRQWLTSWGKVGQSENFFRSFRTDWSARMSKQPNSTPSLASNSTALRQNQIKLEVAAIWALPSTKSTARSFLSALHKQPAIHSQKWLSKNMPATPTLCVATWLVRATPGCAAPSRVRQRQGRPPVALLREQLQLEREGRLLDQAAVLPCTG